MWGNRSNSDTLLFGGNPSSMKNQSLLPPLAITNSTIVLLNLCSGNHRGQLAQQKQFRRHPILSLSEQVSDSQAFPFHTALGTADREAKGAQPPEISGEITETRRRFYRSFCSFVAWNERVEEDEPFERQVAEWDQVPRSDSLQPHPQRLPRTSIEPWLQQEPARQVLLQMICHFLYSSNDHQSYIRITLRSRLLIGWWLIFQPRLVGRFLRMRPLGQ